MNISICITTFNEEDTIAPLLDSLIIQTKSPEAIIIVDGGSTDKTVVIIREYQKQYSIIKLFIKECTRAQGRNFSIKIAKTDLVAITDAGCIADKNWLKNIVKPFNKNNIDIVAGFYLMVGQNAMQKAMSVFLGVSPKKFGSNFLPSTRSMAFRKTAWEKIGGFPETQANSAEDTDFNYIAVKLGLKYARAKNATVEWGIPDSINKFYLKIFNYAKWDAYYGIWWHPRQRIRSHNIKVLLVILRYVIGLVLFIYCFFNRYLLAYWFDGLFVYFLWSFKKVFKQFKDYQIAMWGIVLQIICDTAVILGFISGILGKWVILSKR